MPVYSVAGRRATLDELLREKIQQGSRAGGHQAMKAFRSLCAKGTRADREGVRRALERFNIVSTDDVLDAVMTRFDVDGDGVIDFREFATAILPEDFPAADVAASFETRGGSAKAVRRSSSGENNAANSNSANAPSVSSLVGAAGTAEAVTKLLRVKIAAKYAAGGAASRRAFASLDEDGDGALNLAEFRRCLSNFLIAPPEETTLALYAAHADANLGGIPYATFASAFFPPPAVDPAMDPAAAAAIREEAHRARDAAAARLAAAAAEAEERGGAMTFADARDALGPYADVALARALLDASGADIDGRVTAAAAAAAVAKLRAGDADVAVRRAQRGFVDGFGRDLAEKRGRASAGPVAEPAALSPEALESILREKLAGRGPGGGARACARRSFARLDARRRGWIGKEEFGDALRQFHVPVRPGDVDALVARFDASGTGRVSLADFVERIAPADVPNARETAANARQAAADFFRTLSGLLAEAERRGGGGGTVARDEATAAAKLAAEAARVRLPASAAHHAADAAADDASRRRVRAKEFAAAMRIAATRAAAADDDDDDDDCVADRVAVGASSERRRVRLSGFDALGENSYEPPRAPTPPPFPRRLDVAALAALATEKMLQRTPRGWSEAKQLARALDPSGSGSVTRASYRAALARVGLAAVSDDDADAAFARLAGDAFASVDEVPTAAFVRRALPPSYAERPAKADVLRELVDAGAADERDVRAVLASCGVEMDEAAVGRLLRACEGEEGEGPDMARVAAAVSAPEPRARRPVTPTPAVDHCESEVWDARTHEKTTVPATNANANARAAEVSSGRHDREGDDAGDVADYVEDEGGRRETSRSARVVTLMNLA